MVTQFSSRKPRWLVPSTPSAMDCETRLRPTRASGCQHQARLCPNSRRAGLAGARHRQSLPPDATRPNAVPADDRAWHQDGRTCRAAGWPGLRPSPMGKGRLAWSAVSIRRRRNGHPGSDGRFGGSFPTGADSELLGNVQAELILARPRSFGFCSI
jgi:hypothetical protein